MKTGILFDLDGTLLNTLEDLLNASNYALSVHGFPPRTLQELRSFVGNGAMNQMRLCAPEGTPPEKLQALLDTYKPYYTAHCRENTRPYNGILEALAELGKDYPLGILSNKPDAAVKELCGEHFPGVYALGETPGIPRKPAPDMLYKAMADLGLDRAVYVGDSEVDISTAHTAGLPCLSVLWGFRDRHELDGAEGYCDDPKQLAAKVKELLNG